MNDQLKNSKLITFIVFPMGILAISSSSIITRLAQGGAPSLVIAFYRLFVASALLLPVVLISHRSEFQKIDRRKLTLFILSALFLAAHFATWISSLEYTSIASSVVLVTTTPIWVAIFSPVFLKESISWKMWLGILLAITGSILVGGSQACQFTDSFQLVCPDLDSFFAGRNFLGNMLALVGAWMAAGYMIVGRKLRNQFSISVYALLVYSLAAGFLFILALSLRLPLLGYSTEALMWMSLLGILPQLIGHSTFNWALGYLPATLVSVGIMAEPVGTIILAMIVFRELPLMPELSGGVLILAGILVVSLANRRKKRNNENA